jgi:hypothetical protein
MHVCEKTIKKFVYFNKLLIFNHTLETITALVKLEVRFKTTNHKGPYIIVRSFIAHHSCSMKGVEGF